MENPPSLSQQADPSGVRTPLAGRLSYENERLAAAAAAAATAAVVVVCWALTRLSVCVCVRDENDARRRHGRP